MTIVPAGTRLFDNDNTVRESDLQAYVDGQLDARRRPAIEAYLAARPGEAARLATYRSQNISLHALFDPLDGSDGPQAGRAAALPPALIALAQELDTRINAGRNAAAAAAPRAPSPARVWARALPRLAASVALLLAAGIAGWAALQHSGWQGDDLHVAVTREAVPAPQQQTPLQALPAAAPPAEAAAGSATAAPAKPDAPPMLETLDPALERAPLAPVPLPEAESAAKDT